MLQQLGVYLLKVVYISSLLFLYYHFALRNKRFHYYNRFYLLMSVAISIMLPLLKLQWFTFFSNSAQTIHLYKIVYGGGENEVIVTGGAAMSLQQIALYILAVISILLLMILCTRVIKLSLLKNKYPVQQFEEFNFINTDITSAPFSFLKDIFWRNDINLEEETGKQILQHEITHIRQRHSWDKLFMQFIMCFYWMNPFFYLLKRELYLIHEFIADEEAVKHADADAFAKMLLTAQFGKFDFLPAQSIFYSSIKRRLTMLTTSKNPQFSYVRRIMILPLIASLICLFAFTVKTRNSAQHIPAVNLSKPFVLVVDAGHGGKDNGALGNGLYEKDATLKVAQKIKELSSQYGVDVILTRNSDVFMNPQEKSNFANAQNADAFISIHVNTNDKEHSSQSGFEVYLSPGNEKFGSQNQALGSAILQNLSEDFKAASALQTQSVGIWVLKNSNIPSALIECGYITNKDDATNLKDDAKVELMAKNILEGVAVYANNAVDKSKVYQQQNEQLKDTMPLLLKLHAGTQPLYVINEKIVSKTEADKINHSNIESINVLKDKSATDKYGDKGKNGVIEITMKKSDKADAPPANALYVLDGKIISEDEMKKINSNTIESINVLKDKSATNKYGDKAKDGVVEIYTKNSVIITNTPNNILYLLDGKISTKEAVDKLDPNTIESINVWKDKQATDKYGDKGKNGVIEIKLKENKQSSISAENSSIVNNDVKFK